MTSPADRERRSALERADLQQLFTTARERLDAAKLCIDEIQGVVLDQPAPARPPREEWLVRNPLLHWRMRQRPRPLTRRRAARLLGVSPPSLANWETGERTPNENSFVEIERVTGITRPEWERWLAQRPGG